MSRLAALIAETAARFLLPLACVWEALISERVGVSFDQRRGGLGRIPMKLLAWSRTASASRERSSSITKRRNASSFEEYWLASKAWERHGLTAAAARALVHNGFLNLADLQGAHDLELATIPRLGRRSLAVLHGLMGREARSDDGRPPGTSSTSYTTPRVEIGPSGCR